MSSTEFAISMLPGSTASWFRTTCGRTATIQTTHFISYSDTALKPTAWNNKGTALLPDEGLDLAIDLVIGRTVLHRNHHRVDIIGPISADVLSKRVSNVQPANALATSLPIATCLQLHSSLTVTLTRT